MHRRRFAVPGLVAQPAVEAFSSRQTTIIARSIAVAP
ncbi:hypothetical protein ABIB57_003428 [Devosia sp. UYZn731]